MILGSNFYDSYYTNDEIIHYMIDLCPENIKWNMELNMESIEIFRGQTLTLRKSIIIFPKFADVRGRDRQICTLADKGEGVEN